MPQPAAEAAARIVFLGTASSVPTRGRTNASFAILVADADVWLVDAGPSVLDRLLDVGLAPARVTRVFLTHQHADHLLGMPMLNNARWDADPAARLGVCGPSPALDALRTITLAGYPDHRARFEGLVALHAHATDGSAASEQLGDVLVRSTPARHGVPAVAYRFDVAGASVVFSGDTAPSDAVTDLASGADLLVHDATFSVGRRRSAMPDHSSAEEAGAIAARARVRRLALVHRPPEAAGREDDVRREARRTFDGEVLVPADGDAIELPRRAG